MSNTKEVHYEVTVALERLNDVYKHIDNALALATDSSYLQDILHVASRNLGVTKMKLLVASDMTESVE